MPVLSILTIRVQCRRRQPPGGARSAVTVVHPFPGPAREWSVPSPDMQLQYEYNVCNARSIR
jgi:hypothetical protein